MAKVLIVHASREGHTEHIAERLAETLRSDGHDVRLAPATPFPGTGGADAVIIAASVHRGRHPYGLVRAVYAHRRVLEHMPSAFLSVCLCAAGQDPLLRAEADGYLRDFLRRTGWRPDLAASVAGALRFSRYGFLQARFVRALVRRERIDADLDGDQEFTDWNDIRRFAEAFSALLGEPTPRRFERRPRAPT
ncbi:MAG: flavodoxin domain-containing protein [Deinococcales bacterium]